MAVTVAGVVVLIGIISYLQYLFFTFHIDEENGEFVIQKGILNKTRITIQLHKIQQVNINQSLIQRLVGVHKLEIDTAGSDKKEASISAISHDLATILKERLIHHSQLENSNFFNINKDTISLENKNNIRYYFINFLSYFLNKKNIIYNNINLQLKNIFSYINNYYLLFINKLLFFYNFIFLKSNN